MSEIFTVDDIRRNSGWREIEEEKQAYESRRREIEAERERKRKAVVAEKQQREVVNNSDAWYDAVDTRVRAHFKDWAWVAIDERIQQHLDRHEDIFKDAVGAALGTIRKQVCDQFKCADEQLQRALETKLAEQKERHDGRIEASLARERDATSGAQTQLR